MVEKQGFLRYYHGEAFSKAEKDQMNQTAIPAPFTTSTGTVSSRGVSPEAMFVRKETEKSLDQLQDSFALGFVGKGTQNELLGVVEECSEPNWDGYEADPVTQDAYVAAYRFLEALPLGTPSPTIGAEPDGHISMEWYQSPGRVLSVSISPDCDLNYAALLPGPRKATGKEPFFGEVPSSLLSLIRDVVPFELPAAAIPA